MRVPAQRISASSGWAMKARATLRFSGTEERIRAGTNGATMIEPRKMRKAKVGVFGIGLAAYWPQFKGLKEKLEGYQKQVEKRMAKMGVEVVSAGLVDTAPR